MNLLVRLHAPRGNERVLYRSGSKAVLYHNLASSQVAVEGKIHIYWGRLQVPKLENHDEIEIEKAGLATGQTRRRQFSIS